MAETKVIGKYRSRVAAVTGWTIFFFVLLRVAIGWHFLYEGYWKVKEGSFSATPYLLASQGPLKGFFRWMVFDADGFKRLDPEFQVARINEAYDRISTHYGLSDEQKQALDAWRKPRIEELKSLAMSRDKIDEIKCAAAQRMVAFLSTQPSDAIPATQPGGYAVRKLDVKDIPVDPEVVRAEAADDYQNAVESYKKLLAQVAYEEARMDPKFKAQRLDFNQKKVTTARSALLARIEKPVTLMESGGDPPPPGPGYQTPEYFRKQVNTPGFAPTPEQLTIGGNLTPAQTRALAGIPELSLTPKQLMAGPLPPAHLTKFPGKYLNKLKVGRLIELRFPPKTLTFYIDLMMMVGLVAIGICLILGLFTRFAAFCAVLMLAMFYFSMPPWPGTVDPPNVEGHYLFVNKNLIELIACLMIMSSRVGRWFGLDAFLGAISDRRRRKKAEREAIESAQSPKDRVLIPSDGRAVRETARV